MACTDTVGYSFFLLLCRHTTVFLLQSVALFLSFLTFLRFSLVLSHFCFVGVLHVCESIAFFGGKSLQTVKFIKNRLSMKSDRKRGLSLIGSSTCVIDSFYTE